MNKGSKTDERSSAPLLTPPSTHINKSHSFLINEDQYI